ncbi:hypothetical protein [Sphingomonas sp.]|uniref:hypothetical protein n=1 Tax=Sphingomonas sp. TaxID=28214 RepID=UPI00286DEF51|nr:hypothetical protein [Sphingomonas sp.]
MTRYLPTFLLVGFLAGVAQPSNAAPNDAAKKDEAAAKQDQKMCEDIIPVGSRLAVKRVCASRQEWQTKRRAVREDVDKAQQQRGLLGQ